MPAENKRCCHRCPILWFTCCCLIDAVQAVGDWCFAALYIIKLLFINFIQPHKICLIPGDVLIYTFETSGVVRKYVTEYGCCFSSTLVLRAAVSTKPRSLLKRCRRCCWRWCCSLFLLLLNLAAAVAAHRCCSQLLWLQGSEAS